MAGRTGYTVGIAMAAVLLALTSCATGDETSLARSEPTTSAESRTPAPDPPSLDEGHVTAGSHRITLWHCGIEPTTFVGRRWIADPVPFDATHKGWALKGTMRLVNEKRAEFVNEDGEKVRFVPLEGEWKPPPCA